jgi:Spy/CpxP family protein refolding chaperone
MRMTKTLTTVSGAIIILAVALAAEARGFGPAFPERSIGPGSMMGPGRTMDPGLMGPPRSIGPGLMGLEKLLELNLSESQQTELLAILHKYEHEMEGIRDRSIAASKKLAIVIHAEDFDENELRKALREASSLKEELVVLRARMIAELKKVLTEEQKLHLNDRKAKIVSMIKGLLAE